MMPQFHVFAFATLPRRGHTPLPFFDIVHCYANGEKAAAADDYRLTPTSAIITATRC